MYHDYEMGYLNASIKSKFLRNQPVVHLKFQHVIKILF